MLSFLFFLILHTKCDYNGISPITKHEMMEQGYQPSAYNCFVCRKPLQNVESELYNRCWKTLAPKFRVPNILPGEIFVRCMKNGSCNKFCHYSCLVKGNYIQNFIDLENKSNSGIFCVSPCCGGILHKFGIDGLISCIRKYISSEPYAPAYYDCFAIYAYMMQLPLVEVLDDGSLDIPMLEQLRLLLKKEKDPYAQILLISVDLLLSCKGPEKLVKTCFAHLEKYIKSTPNFLASKYRFLENLVALIKREKTTTEEIEAHIFRVIDCYQQSEKAIIAGTREKYLVRAFLATQPSRKQVYNFIEKLIMSEYSILLGAITSYDFKNLMPRIDALALILYRKLENKDNYKNIASSRTFRRSIAFLYIIARERKPFCNFFFNFILKKCLQSADRCVPAFNGINFENGLYGNDNSVLESVLFSTKEKTNENLLKSTIANVIYDFILGYSVLGYTELSQGHYLEVFKKALFLEKRYSKTPQKYFFMSYCLVKMPDKIGQYFPIRDIPILLRYATSKAILSEIYSMCPAKFYKEFVKTLNIPPRLYVPPIEGCMHLLLEKHETENIAALRASPSIFKHFTTNPLIEFKDEYSKHVAALIKSKEFEKSGMLVYRVKDKNVFKGLSEQSVVNWCKRNHFATTTIGSLSNVQSAKDAPVFFQMFFPTIFHYFDASAEEGVCLGKRIRDIMELLKIVHKMKRLTIRGTFGTILRTKLPYEYANIWLLCLEENERISLMSLIIQRLCNGHRFASGRAMKELLSDILEYHKLHMHIRRMWHLKRKWDFRSIEDNFGHSYFDACRALDKLELFEKLALYNSSFLHDLQRKYNDFYRILITQNSYLPEFLIRNLIERKQF
ncbi:hypothetical protein ENBRE01_0102 [Enteropsectra breve]|nr:hypothetical protein ENBRE01_0102 [Enteropsectra breve]